MSSAEAKALEQLFTSFGREFQGRLLPMSVTFPGLTKRPAPAPGSEGELSPTAKVALWNAAVKLLLTNSTFTDKCVAKPGSARGADEDAA